ncbi:MAG: hypothetical protein KME02_08085 [Aphanothece saxicola GSE-SYN-MK-01-06B]|jgi:hypothetical protein|nr:hypothetical protein [Aphanothece saxicola GSE-SYN-MK-01-06B]
MILHSITKTVSIQAPVTKVFDYLSNPANWPQWAILNIKSIRASEDGWWDMETPMGQAKLRIPDASWTVPARIVPNGDGCEFMMTFFQPATFGNDFFKQQVDLVDQEMAKLRELMEI